MFNKQLVDEENRLVSKLEDHETVCIKEINTKFEVFEKESEKEKEIVHKTINDLQLQADKLIYYCKQQSQCDDIKRAHINKDDTKSKIVVTNVKNHKKEDTTISESIDEEAKEMLNTNVKASLFNPNILALMRKIGVCQYPALSYDLQTATISVDCDDPTEKEKIKEEFYTAYQELVMGGKLKEHAFPVDDVQQANVIVDEYTKTFSHTYFRYDPEKKEIKCLSTDAQQMQNVWQQLISMKKVPNPKSVCIDLPKLSRRVTIKFGDIVEEEVDIIVNPANDRLMHSVGVAAAIDKASGGVIQTESRKVIHMKNIVPTGEAVATVAGGALKCKHVIHAVGADADHHKNQCGLLKNACINAMKIAQNLKATSIAFPPISPGNCGIPSELVADSMLSTLCSYACSDPELLIDVRIIIIDEPTFEVFLNHFLKQKENLELLQYTRPINDSSKAAATTYHGMQAESVPQLALQKGMNNLELVDLPNCNRRVTIKLGNIVQEEVDVIVNAANMHLYHFMGVAAAIDKASGGVVREECRKITSAGKVIPTGSAVATAAGGALKCKYVIHVVGPITNLHKDECSVLLKEACISAMNIAQNFEAASIAFPPICPDNSGVPADIVAEVMLSTLCSYKCSNPTLLSDVCIVIADKPTFEVFLSVLNKKQRSSHAVTQQLHTFQDTNSSTATCPICFDNDPLRVVDTSKQCKEVYCKRFLDEALNTKPYCPTCTVPLNNVTGTQPTGGTMTVHTYPKQKLPGYKQYGTIKILYNIPSGIQDKEHPNHGQHFDGMSHTAYLPDSPEGKKVLRLLKKAFNARLLFTVETSYTSGATDKVVWNGIHHKTNTSGGPTRLVISFVCYHVLY